MLKNFKYNTFGLHEDWVYLFLKENFASENKGILGPRQYDSLIAYLRDFEILDKEPNNNFLNCINRLFTSKKNNLLIIWSLLWVNLTHNSSLFLWWCKQDKSIFSREKILENMVLDYGKINRYLINGLNSLISTFEYTPIGKDLKIGIVWREKNKRYVKKEGGYPFDPYVVLYALYKYSHKNNVFQIDIDFIESDIYSPQKILVVESNFVKNAVLELNEPELIRSEVKESRLIVNLDKNIHPYYVIKRYIEKENL